MIWMNIEEYHPNKKNKILLFFNETTADMLSDKSLNPMVIELFIRDRQLSISLAFITQSYFLYRKILG